LWRHTRRCAEEPPAIASQTPAIVQHECRCTVRRGIQQHFQAAAQASLRRHCNALAAQPATQQQARLGGICRLQCGATQRAGVCHVVQLPLDALVQYPFLLGTQACAAGQRGGGARPARPQQWYYPMAQIVAIYGLIEVSRVLAPFDSLYLGPGAQLGAMSVQPWARQPARAESTQRGHRGPAGHRCAPAHRARYTA